MKRTISPHGFDPGFVRSHRMRSFAALTGILVMSAAFNVLRVVAADTNSDYVTPESTFSPNGRYAVMVPVFHTETAESEDNRKNKVLELKTGNIVAVIDAEPGYDRALNYHQIAPPRWSSDSTLLLWKVSGKWFPDALVLIKLEQDRVVWQLNLMKTAQEAVLTRTRKAAPKQYLITKKANAGNGSAYPEGFTIDVSTDGEDTKGIALPLGVHVDLTANPKQIEGKPNLDSHLDAVVTTDGKFAVKHFQLGARTR